MKVYQFNALEIARQGWTHRFEITFADLVALGAVLAGTVSLMDYVAGQGIIACAHKLVTPFTGPSVTNLALIAGWDGVTTDDDDGLIAASREICSAASYVNFGDGNGAAFATLRTGYFPLDAGTYKAKFTAIGANLNVLTAGEVHLFLREANLTKAS